MRAAEERAPARRGKLLAIALIVTAVVILMGMVRNANLHPSTDAASIEADTVHIAPEVGGRLAALAVTENSAVKRGDLLFQLDPEPYVHALEQARAELAMAEATLASQQRLVSSQTFNAATATEQTRKAITNSNLAQRTVERLRPLASAGYVPQQQLDQAEVGARDAVSSLAQARQQQSSTMQAVDTIAGARAAVEARRAMLALAERSLRHTTIRAPHNGRITGLSVATGELLVPAQPLFTLIATEDWFSSGNFRETQLRHIRIGDCATVYSMIDGSRPMRGRVTGIGAGVMDGEKLDLPRGVPYVEKSLNWVRVSQRFPVRVALDAPPADLVRVGASARIEIGHGRACR